MHLFCKGGINLAMGITRYNIDDHNILNVNYELLYISKSKFENDWHSTAHFHPFTEIFFITNGSGNFHLDDKIVNVTKGDLVIINPNCLHTEKSNTSKEPLEYIVLGIENFIFAQHGTSSLLCNTEVTQELYTILHYDRISVLLQFFDPLINEIENKPQNYEVVCKSIITLLIIFLSRGSSQGLDVNNTSKEPLNIECMKIKNYLDSHYSDNITLEKLASICHVNKFHLVHSFTKQVGVSPINYVINKRIDEAKTLLKTTNYSIRDISSIVGFSNSSYFSQMFKKITGFSPKTYKTKS